MIYRLILFLILNFATLALGSFMAGRGPRSEWYAGISKAPWTPPGWVFGASWTIIMICFSIYLAYLWPAIEDKKILIGILIMHYLLNLAWNPTFFYYHKVLAALFIITALTLVIGFIFLNYWSVLDYKSLLIAPYLIWLIIATSLNAYVQLKN